MNEEAYNNRELDTRFVSVEDKMDLHFEEVNSILVRIESQTVKTNGRVTNLEFWRWLITGGLMVFTIVILPAVAWLILQIVNLNLTIQMAVQTALIPYTK